MRETFTPRRFQGASRQIIEMANSICQEYAQQGYNLTLRQVYYQFVARGLLGNSDRNYKRLGSVINDARLAGEMDWSYIQDRTRNVRGNFSGYRDPGHYIGSVADGYFEAIWEGQHFRPEVWVEKDALVDIVARACGQTRTPYLSCRGYVSQSEMYAAAKRFETRRGAGLEPLVIHLGDHDPSGIDMTRDIRERLSLMSWGRVEVLRIALTMDQIRTYDPPPNPAKLSDSRGADYVERYGYESWELDALEPSVLDSLIQETVEGYIDRDQMNERIVAENENEARIREVSDRWEDLTDRWDEVLEVIDS